MKLRRFNRDGIAAFSDYRARLTLEPTLEPPLELLEDPALTEPLAGDVAVQARKFANRLEAGRFFNELMDAAKVQLPERDQGLWTWLTLFYFDEVCPADGNGRRTPKDEARLIPLLDNHQRFYRHLLVGPFLIVRAHRAQPERAIAMLCNPLWEPGEIAEQLASRKELVTNHAVADVATHLYYDPATGSFKRGASSKVKGAARRLATLFNQLDLTFYLYGMSRDEMLALLPKEFDRFRAKAV
ncbi:MAG: hypothetical protein MUF81_19745 [Verrucomicrobia bacterium]|jgi:hypothetical protein|nr:hypothetical protein [Verrucomicrobiota bacterium]